MSIALRLPSSVFIAAGAAAVLALSAAPNAVADTVGNITVSAQTSVYATSSNTYGGAAGVIVPITSGATSITFTITETGGARTVTVNGGGSYNTPDGTGSASGEYNTGTSGAGMNFSGITTPTAGFLAGIFTDGTGSEVATPLDYTTTSSVSSSSYSPTLDQAFFIGDALTGDGTGTPQIFYVPTGATSLQLGLTDACGYNGSPSCYNDNSGSFTLTYDEAVASVTPPPPPPATAATPEPSSLVLLATGALGSMGAIRRRLATRQS